METKPDLLLLQPLMLTRRSALAGIAATVVAPFLLSKQAQAGWAAIGHGAADSAVADEPLSRRGHTSTEMPYGTVVVGGYRHGALSSVQILSGGKWQNAPSLKTPRYGHAAIAWKGGVLVVGGISTTGLPLSSAEFFDGNEWTRVASMTTPRELPALAIYDGAPMVIGGRNRAPLSSVEVFDGIAWQRYPSNITPRFGHSAEIVSGQLVVEGGQNFGRLTSVESFDGVVWNQAAIPPQKPELY